MSIIKLGLNGAAMAALAILLIRAHRATQELRGENQILRQQIAQHDSAPIEQVSQSIRRDYFIGYPLRLPKRIYPGRHTVQLTVEDTLGHKVGQSTIELAVKKEE